MRIALHMLYYPHSMKVSSRTYTLSIEHEDDGYLAYFPALLGCHTWGKTYEAAVRNAEEALELYLETLAAHGDPFPEDQAVDQSVSLGVTVRTPVIS
jgi:predicted RNase H-like HicB family nuclease